MTKKTYIKPAIIKVVELRNKYQLLAGSANPSGIRTTLVDETVDYGF